MRVACVAILSGALLCGCASTTDIQTRYLSETAVAPAPSLLLVARTPETDHRVEWEDACADELDKPSLSLTRSHKVLPLWNEAGNDRLLIWAQKNDVDAVLIAEITGMLLAPPQIPPQTFVQSERGINQAGADNPTWSLALGGKQEPTSPPPEVHEVEIQFLDRQGKTRWNGVTQTHEANDIEAIAKSQCRALRKALEGLRLLP